MGSSPSGETYRGLTQLAECLYYKQEVRISEFLSSTQVLVTQRIEYLPSKQKVVSSILTKDTGGLPFPVELKKEMWEVSSCW